jgi:hypothetical protein
LFKRRWWQMLFACHGSLGDTRYYLQRL